MHNGAHMLLPSEQIRQAVQDALRKSKMGARRFEGAHGLQMWALRGLLDPTRKQSPSIDRAAEICKAIGLAIHIGPPRESSTPVPSAPTGAADAIRQRFYNEDLRREINAVRSEMAEALDEVISRLPRPAQGLDALAEPESGKVVEFPDPDAEICGLPYRVNIGGAAGPGAFVDDENVIKLIGFRRDWLRKHGINPDKCSLIDVLGNSMEPELRDKAIILIDHQRTRRLVGRIFAVRSDDGLQIKRLAHENHDWLLVSDNEAYPPVPWPREAEVIGQVMWAGRTL